MTELRSGPSIAKRNATQPLTGAFLWSSPGHPAEGAAGSRRDKKQFRSHSIALLAAALSMPMAFVLGQESEPRPVQDERAVEPKEDAKKPPAAPKVDVPTIRRRLQARTDLKVDNVPLKEVVAQLARRHSVPIRLDEASLKKAGIAVDASVTASIKNLTLNETLRQVLKGLHLQHDLKDGAIVISADAEDDLAAAGKAHVERMDEKRQRAEDEARAVADVQNAKQARPGVGLVDPDQAVAEGDALLKQFEKRFKSVLRDELNFVEKVCEPTDDQMAEIRQVLEKYKADVVKRQADLQKRAARGQRQATVAYADPRKLIRDSLKRTLKTTLDSERWARFDGELEQRKTDQTRAAVHNIVAKIDRDLALSAEQREKLVGALTAAWSPAWGQQFEIFLQQGGQFAPNVSPKVVTPHLNPIQKKIWSGTQANQQNQQVILQQGVFLGGGMAGPGGLMGIALDELGDDEGEDDEDE